MTKQTVSLPSILDAVTALIQKGEQQQASNVKFIPVLSAAVADGKFDEILNACETKLEECKDDDKRKVRVKVLRASLNLVRKSAEPDADSARLTLIETGRNAKGKRLATGKAYVLIQKPTAKPENLKNVTPATILAELVETYTDEKDLAMLAAAAEKWLAEYKASHKPARKNVSATNGAHENDRLAA